MPPRKKQKKESDSNPTDPIRDRPTNFPDANLLSRALKQYGHAISLRSKEHTKTPDELTALDAWLTNSESGLIRKIACSEPVNKAEMTSLMKWKLSRGKSRPTLLALVSSNPETLVLQSTTAALQAVRDAKDDLDGALLALPDACKMRGVGAATASALLTLQTPHLLPFMSDEAASFFTSTLGQIKYTDAFYKKFAAAMVAEVGRLNADSESDDAPQLWDSMKLERALFAISILKKHGQELILDSDPDVSSASTSGSLKRQRDS
ncbi:hypothetical protein DFH08DRAFT_861944 [Mycena albidolilacea]|uniref:Uncharacterized protein n=1 Tax=Mycena albidolilacea TaxID=1033008 RepID=A0AAD7A6I8_9AGAR|nr:hypothetical protein DFH08DRAFT_861944 [Mycena albidolilacea]